MKRRGQVSLFIILGLIMVLFIGLSIYAYSYVVTKQSQQAVVLRGKQAEFENLLVSKTRCIDNTEYGFCSRTVPLLCNNGVLEFDCQSCGCLADEICRPSGECVKNISSAAERFTVFFVPVNSEPGDVDFLSRAEIYKETLKLETALREENFVIVNASLYLPSEQCQVIGGELDPFVDDWFQKNTGRALPGVDFQGGIPVYKYRIVGIDKGAQDEAVCGCAYTQMYAPFIYIGGNDCGRSAIHAALHEFGHTFGLCDEYDTCVWDDTDELLRNVFGHPCLNVRPTDENSDCGTSCCSDEGACCNGKFADTVESGFMNVMGSAQLPPGRRFGSESRVLIDNFLCDNVGVCS